MHKRNLGKSMKVSSVGLGCMGITHASGTPLTKAEGMKVLESALEIGYNFFDTAECYTGTNPDGTVAYNEEVVGAVLKPVRNKVILASKCGVTHGKDHLIMDSRPQSIRKALEGSLKRLGTDYIDLYYQHRIDPKVEPEEVAGTMSDLMKEGKIILDIQGEEKKQLTVRNQLDQFEKASGQEFSNDSALLSRN